MDTVNVTILSESERLGVVRNTLLIGAANDELIASLHPTPEVRTAQDILASDPGSIDPAELVILLPDATSDKLEKRALAVAAARLTSRAAISVQRLGEELPIPLIELKRGLLLDSLDLGYRVYGTREGQL